MSTNYIDQIKDTAKDNKKIKNKNKENVLNKYKIFSEKRNYTTYNTQNNNKKNKKFLINEIQSPNNKKEKYQNQNTETKKKSLNTKKYFPSSDAQLPTFSYLCPEIQNLFNQLLT